MVTHHRITLRPLSPAVADSAEPPLHPFFSPLVPPLTELVVLSNLTELPLAGPGHPQPWGKGVLLLKNCSIGIRWSLSPSSEFVMRARMTQIQENVRWRSLTRSEYALQLHIELTI